MTQRGGGDLFQVLLAKALEVSKLASKHSSYGLNALGARRVETDLDMSAVFQTWK